MEIIIRNLMHFVKAKNKALRKTETLNKLSAVDLRND